MESTENLILIINHANYMLIYWHNTMKLNKGKKKLS